MAITLKQKNFAVSNLNSSILSNAATLTIAVGDETKFPTAPFLATIWSTGIASPTYDPTREIVKVTNVASNTLTILRAQEGTVAKAWTTGSKIANTLTSGKLTELETEINGKLSSSEAATLYLNKNSGTLPWAQIDKSEASPADIGAEAEGAVLAHSQLFEAAHGGIVLTSDGRLADARTPLAHSQAESTITFTHIPNGNVSITKHGFVPILPDHAGKFFNGKGNYITPASGAIAPTTAASTGVAGEIRYDAENIYICIATNTWKRSPLTAW